MDKLPDSAFEMGELIDGPLGGKRFPMREMWWCRDSDSPPHQAPAVIADIFGEEIHGMWPGTLLAPIYLYRLATLNGYQYEFYREITRDPVDFEAHRTARHDDTSAIAVTYEQLFYGKPRSQKP
jgi:hypothetical protein